MDAPSSRSSDAAYAAPEVMDSTASRHRSREANALEAEASALAAAIASFARARRERRATGAVLGSAERAMRPPRVATKPVVVGAPKRR